MTQMVPRVVFVNKNDDQKRQLTRGFKTLNTELAKNGLVENPRGIIVELFVNDFGFGNSNAVRRAKEVLDEFKQQNVSFEFVYKGKRLTAIRKVELLPRVVESPKVLPTTDEKLGSKLPKKKKNSGITLGDKGRARGAKSENHLHSALCGLNKCLLKNFPSVVFEASCKKSESHDADDMKGQDILWHLKSSVGEGDCIIQVKSSWISVHKFNNEEANKIFSGQEHARFKKAFNGNIKRRKKTIVQELLKEAILVNLLPRTVESAIENF